MSLLIGLAGLQTTPNWRGVMGPDPQWKSMCVCVRVLLCIVYMHKFVRVCMWVCLCMGFCMSVFVCVFVLV